MKILHVLRSPSWGGLELYTLEVIKNLQAHGLDCVLLCLPNSVLDREARQSGVKVVHSLRFLFGDYHAIHVHRRQDLLIARASLCFRPKIKLIYSLMMNAPPKKDFYHRWIYSRVDALFSSSELLKNKVIENFPINPTHVHLLRYGRELSVQRFSSEQIADFKASQKIPSNKKIFGTMCRIDPGKGVIDIANAIELLSDSERQQIEIWIIGDPTIIGIDSGGQPQYYPESLEAVKHLQEKSQMPIYKDVLRLIPFQKNPVPYLSTMDVFILATNKEETYSLAVIDAMILGLPVMGTRSGGTIEQIGLNEERGVFIEPSKPESIAQAIRKYLHNPNLIVMQGQRAKDWARSEHDWKKCVVDISRSYGD